MEPGHEDREYLDGGDRGTQRVRASMEPGHEDREYMEGYAKLFLKNSRAMMAVMVSGKVCRGLR